jgi:hypothetical protein
MQDEARDAEAAEAGELHAGDEERAGREVLLQHRGQLRRGAEAGPDHRGRSEPHEAHARGADHAEVGEVADEREHVRYDRPERHVAPALERCERLADGIVEDGEHGARPERVRLLADGVDLVRPRESRHRRQALFPRTVEPTLGRPEVEDEVHATSTGAPDAAEA